MRGASVDVMCEVCGKTVPRKSPIQRRCGDRACKKRGQYLARAGRPEFQAKNRARAAAWYVRNAERHKANVAARKVTSKPKTGAAGPWFITPHALERFCERAPHVDAERREDALAALIDEARGAHFVKLLPSGAELWRGPKPRRLRYIVQPGEGALPALVTVAASHDGAPRC